MEKKTVLTIIGIVFLISILFSIFAYNKTKIIRTKTIQMDLKVSDHGGFNLDKDAMHFGQITKGGTSKRTINFHNSFPFDVRVNFRTYGKLADWLKINNSSFVLTPNSTKSSYFKIYVPKNASLGVYNGSIKVIFKRT